MKQKKINIGVLGMWHLGCIYATSFAKHGYMVTGFDFDKALIHDLQANKPPLFEPQLKGLLKKYTSKTLFFSTNPKEAIANKDYLFVTFDLPINNIDTVSIKPIKRVEKLIKQYASDNTIVIISSQVPVGTSRKLMQLLENTRRHIEVIYFPENLQLGNAYYTFLHPDRIILGSNNHEIVKKFITDFAFFKCPFTEMSLESAEMLKHAINSYLATCISLSAELTNIAELVGANMIDVVAAMKTDARVSEKAPLNPGLGFSGGTLGRDIQSLQKIAKRRHYSLQLLPAVYDINKQHIPMLLQKVQIIYPKLSGKSIGILGLTYKPNTSTLRRAFSLELATLLHKKGVKIKAYDPTVATSIVDYPYIKISHSLENFFSGLDAAIIMTEWPEFNHINSKKIAKLMRHKVIIDAKNFLNAQPFLKEQFTFIGMGVTYK